MMVDFAPKSQALEAERTGRLPPTLTRVKTTEGAWLRI